MSTASPPRRRSKPSVPPEEALRLVSQRLGDTRSRVILQRGIVGLLIAGTIAGLALLVMALADYLWEVPTSGRAAWLGLVGVAGVAALIAGWKRWIRDYTVHETAADVEHQVSGIGQRLRTTLDYQEEEAHPAAASPDLLDAMRGDTYQAVKRVDWDGAVSGRPLGYAILVSIAGGLIWVFCLAASSEFRTAAGRTLLIPWHYTTVTFTPQESTVRRGESVEVTAEITGRPVTSAQLRYRPTGSQGAWTIVDLAPPEEVDLDPGTGLSGNVTATLADLTADLEFEVVSGPVPLPPGSIRVLQPLRVSKWQATITPPAYTGLSAEVVQSANVVASLRDAHETTRGDKASASRSDATTLSDSKPEPLHLRVLEGSTVEVQITLSRPAAEGQLAFACGGAQSESEAQPPADVSLTPSGSLLAARLADLRASVSGSITASAADGIALDPLPVRIRVQIDKRPEIAFVEPPEELVVTATTEVPVQVEAKDDVGLHKVGLLMQVNDGELQPLWEGSGEGATDTLRGAVDLLLEDHGLDFTDSVTYHAFAEDMYFGEPRRTTTPLRFIDIRPYKIAYQLAEGGGSCQNCSTTLEELIARQRENLVRSFAAEQEASIPDGLAQRLLTAETDLRDKTREFADGLAALGEPVLLVEDAALCMEGAMEALTEPRLPEAVENEQAALASLIKARENLRKKLSQSSSASACQKFDREMRQKLRTPPPKQQDRQQQLAQKRQQLEDLAKRERKWSQQASAACQNPSSSSSSSSASSSSSGSPSQSQPNQSSQQSNPNEQSAQNPSQNQAQNPSENQQSPEQARADAAQKQQELMDELAALQRELEQMNAASDAARQQSGQAAAAMQRGLNALNQQQGDQAQEQGERAAEQLEQLSAHLAAMNARDFGERLEQAQQMAQDLAMCEASLEQQLANQSSQKNPSPSSQAGTQQSSQGGQSGSQSESSGQDESSGSSGQQSQQRQQGSSSNPQSQAEEQAALAARTDMLAELLDALRRDAIGEHSGVRSQLEEIDAENPPGGIAEQMRETADALRQQEFGQAVQGASQSREQLDELSRALSQARRDYATPQLEELMALEEQLARLVEQMRRGEGDAARESTAEGKWQELEPRLDALAAGDERLAEALSNLREGNENAGRTGSPSGPQSEPTTTNRADSQNGRTTSPSYDRHGPAPYRGGERRELREGEYTPDQIRYVGGYNEISKVLQTKIQEAILAGALMDSDQPVPPEYRKLVDEYYRTLSDDLR